MKTRLIALSAVVTLAVFAQSSSSPSPSEAKSREQERLVSDQRLNEQALMVRRQLDTVRLAQNRALRMPGANYPSAEEKLIVQLAEQVLLLQEETVTLKRQVERLSAK